MAHLQYSYYPGVGEEATKVHGYKQAVRVGDKIECSGQGDLNSISAPMQTFV